MGQAAYLRKFPEDVGDTFYKSLPGAVGILWSLGIELLFLLLHFTWKCV
jgi:hypothetical protein